MKFRKKPVVIEAIRWDGQNTSEVLNFMKGEAYKYYSIDGQYLEIQTLEGAMKASVGDWIIQGVRGEFYPCKPDIFELTYEIL